MDTVFYLDAVLAGEFEGIMDDIYDNLVEWFKWAHAEDPHVALIPDEWEKKLSRFNKLIVVKVWRPKKLLSAVTEYVKMELGTFYITAPPSGMDDVFPDTDPATPFIYILSMGADPTSVLYKFATKSDYMDKLQTISLGQGQGPKAEELIIRAKKSEE